MKKTAVFGCLVLAVMLSASRLTAEFVYVPASAFHTQDESGGLWLEGMYGQYVYRASTGHGWLYAPVSIPDGAVIKNARLLYYDNGGYIEFHFYRYNMYSGSAHMLFDGTTVGLPASTEIRSLVDSSVSPLAPSYRKVHANALSYTVRVSLSQLGDTLRIYGFVIEYQLP